MCGISWWEVFPWENSNQLSPRLLVQCVRWYSEYTAGMTYLEIVSDPDKCRYDKVLKMKIVMAIEKMKEQKWMHTHIFSSHIYFVYIYWKNTVIHWYMQGIGSRTLSDAKSCGCLRPLYKMVQYLHITYAHSPIFKSSINCLC